MTPSPDNQEQERLDNAKEDLRAHAWGGFMTTQEAKQALKAMEHLESLLLQAQTERDEACHKAETERDELAEAVRAYLETQDHSLPLHQGAAMEANALRNMRRALSHLSESRSDDDK